MSQYINAVYLPMFTDVGYVHKNGKDVTWNKSDAKIWKTENGAGAAAVKMQSRFKEPFVTFPKSTSERRIRAAMGSRAHNPKKRSAKKKTTRKKNPAKPFIIFAYNYKWKADYLRFAYDNKGKFGLTRDKAKALDFATSKEALEQANRMANQYPPGVAIGVMRKSDANREVVAFLNKGTDRGKANRRTGRRKNNPVGPTQKQVDNAHNLFRDFRGDHPEELKKVQLRNPKVGLVVGELDGVLYTTTRDGKKEKYIHEFKDKSRPTLIASHDGKSLHVLGGEYEFTEAGIEDR